MKLIIFDKDGTLVHPESGKTFVDNPTDQVLFPGVKEKIKKLVESGTTAVIASNQGGVAAGHKSITDAIAEMQYCLGLLDGLIDTGLFCPDFEGKTAYAVGLKDPNHPRLENYCSFQGCDFRKPGAGMLDFAMSQYTEIRKIKSFEPHQCLMIGDRAEDAEAADAAGIDFLDAEKWRKGFHVS
jgi:D-glycero-D-manno-heptose 1,7-bisphosphate phosphatase